MSRNISYNESAMKGKETPDSVNIKACDVVVGDVFNASVKQGLDLSLLVTGYEGECDCVRVTF